MGRYEVLKWLKEREDVDPGSDYSIRDISDGLKKEGVDCSVKPRQIRKIVVSLEADRFILARQRGTMTRWYRYFRYNPRN